MQFNSYGELLNYFSTVDKKDGKTRKATTVVDGVELSARVKAVSMLERRTEEMEGGLWYTLETAEEYYVSREEVIERIHQKDPNASGDAEMFATSEIDYAAPRAEEDEVEACCKAIKKIYGLLAQEKVLAELCEVAPKKKNGTFAMNQYTRIACAGLVDHDGSVLEIIGKPSSDKVLDVQPKFMHYSPEEHAKINSDYLFEHYDTLLDE